MALGFKRILAENVLFSKCDDCNDRFLSVVMMIWIMLQKNNRASRKFEVFLPPLRQKFLKCLLLGRSQAPLCTALLPTYKFPLSLSLLHLYVKM